MGILRRICFALAIGAVMLAAMFTLQRCLIGSFRFPSLGGFPVIMDADLVVYQPVPDSPNGSAGFTVAEGAAAGIVVERSGASGPRKWKVEFDRSPLSLGPEFWDVSGATVIDRDGLPSELRYVVNGHLYRAELGAEETAQSETVAEIRLDFVSDAEYDPDAGLWWIDGSNFDRDARTSTGWILALDDAGTELARACYDGNSITLHTLSGGAVFVDDFDRPGTFRLDNGQIVFEPRPDALTLDCGCGRIVKVARGRRPAFFDTDRDLIVTELGSVAIDPALTVDTEPYGAWWLDGGRVRVVMRDGSMFEAFADDVDGEQSAPAGRWLPVDLGGVVPAGRLSAGHMLFGDSVVFMDESGRVLGINMTSDGAELVHNGLMVPPGLERFLIDDDEETEGVDTAGAADAAS